MDYFRKRAVQAIREDGYGPEIVAEVFGFSRSCIYEWLTRYDQGGYDALASRKPPGAEPVITPDMDVWLKETVLNSTPVAHGFDTFLWTRDILADLIRQQFGVTVAGVTVGLHLQQLGLSYQKPCYRDVKRNEQDIEFFLNVKFPRIRQLAKNMGADIGFEDEAGVGLRTRAGRTWGAIGHPPEIQVATQRGGYNVLSIVLPQGEMQYTVTADTVDAEQYIHFLKELLEGRTRPLILVMDRASFHRAKKVSEFVRAHRTQLRIFFFPKASPELNPDEQVWNEIKNHKIGKQPVKNKVDLRKRLESALSSLQQCTQRIQSFFQLPDTKYASVNVC
ncbi:MAG: Transposase [Candidatus Accumulibacter phosphatis]|uniref:Transposase n=1 Tax=Candidatus Accumulibacter phosphatis TaxID=327160 RepID=A0A080LRM8_9PROT|nr:MAG: Transposase [Candidatus Accumulibacter phosphatis]